MVKRIESYNTFDESSAATRKAALKLSLWERWVKGIELSEYALILKKSSKLNPSQKELHLETRIYPANLKNS